MNDIRLVGLDQVPPYPLTLGVDLYSIDPPPMLIDGILPKKTITGLTSKPGTGKTWFALEAIRAIATGGQFLGKYQAEKGSVLFVGSDASIHDYARQWKKLTLNEWSDLAPDEGDKYNPLDDNVRFLFQSDFIFEDIDTVRRLIKTSNSFVWDFTDGGPLGTDWESGFSLIIFDTLSKLTRCNQNDNSEMEVVFRNIRLISERTGAGILLLHHNSGHNEYNDGEDWRGAKGQIAALDNWFQLGNQKGFQNRKEVTVKKFRGITPNSFVYDLLVDDTTAELKAIDKEGNSFKEEFTKEILSILQERKGNWLVISQILEKVNQDVLMLYPSKEKLTFSIKFRLDELVQNSKVRKIKEKGRNYYTAVIEEINEPAITES